jgi:hypothetical protein
MEVTAVGSPDRQSVVFGRTYAASPNGRAGPGTKAGAAAAAAAAEPARHSGSGSLLAAALRLQGIGGRSVGLQRGSR